MLYAFLPDSITNIMKLLDNFFNLVLFVVINIVFLKFSDRTLIRIGCIFYFFGTMFAMACVGFVLILIDSKNEDAKIALLITYGLLMVLSMSIGYCFLLIGCYCYMIKCIPKQRDYGVVVGIFLISTIACHGLSDAIAPLMH